MRNWGKVESSRRATEIREEEDEKKKKEKIEKRGRRKGEEG
jgi:hypothetical protein